ELEEDRVGERRALAEQAARHRDGRVRAAGAGGAEQGGESDASQVVLAEDVLHGAAGDDRLDHRGDEEAEGERPEHLPEHEEGHLQRIPDGAGDPSHGWIYTAVRNVIRYRM